MRTRSVSCWMRISRPWRMLLDLTRTTGPTWRTPVGGARSITTMAPARIGRKSAHTGAVGGSNGQSAPLAGYLRACGGADVSARTDRPCLRRAGLRRTNMPEKKTIERAREDKRKGKAPTTQAGEFVREEIHKIRHGEHGARSPEQAIAIGLS